MLQLIQDSKITYEVMTYLVGILVTVESQIHVTTVARSPVRPSAFRLLMSQKSVKLAKLKLLWSEWHVICLLHLQRSVLPSSSQLQFANTDKKTQFLNSVSWKKIIMLCWI